MELPWRCEGARGNGRQWLISILRQARDVHGRTPVIAAALGNNHETVIACIDNGANLEAVDELGRSALSYMASNNNVEGLMTLLEVHEMAHPCPQGDVSMPLGKRVVNCVARKVVWMSVSLIRVRPRLAPVPLPCHTQP